MECTILETIDLSGKQLFDTCQTVRHMLMVQTSMAGKHREGIINEMHREVLLSIEVNYLLDENPNGCSPLLQNKAPGI